MCASPFREKDAEKGGLRVIYMNLTAVVVPAS